MTLLPPPSGPFKPMPPATRAACVEAVRQRTHEGRLWSEKVRRFASLHGRRLANEGRSRFGAEAPAHLGWMTLLLLEAGRAYQDADAPLVDAAMLGAALFCIDASASAKQYAARAEQDTAELSRWLQEVHHARDCDAMGADFVYQPALWKAESRHVSGLVIFCPSPYSLVSAAVLALCHRLAIKPAAVVIRKFTARRFAAEWRRDGPRLLRKIWRKLVLRADENAARTVVSLSQLWEGLARDNPDVRKMAAAHAIPVYEVDGFDSAIEGLQPLSPRIGIFTGGGMLGKPVLDIFSGGIVNPHMGPLPQYKGMDVVQAPVLEGRFNSVAITAHYMVPELDAGPVFQTFKVNSGHYASLGAMRNEVSALLPLIALDTALGICSGRLSAHEQTGAGRQYYFVHPKLIAVVEAVLSARTSCEVAQRGPNPLHSTVRAVLAEFGETR